MKIKKYLISLFVALFSSTLLFNNTTVKADEKVAVERNLVYVKGSCYTLNVPKTAGKVKWRISDQGILENIKVYGKNKNKIKVQVNKTGNCKVYATTSNAVYIYNIHAEPKVKIKSYQGNKTKISLLKCKKTDTYFVLRIQIANGKKSLLDYEVVETELQRKENGNWNKIETNGAISGVGHGISGKTKITFSVNLTGLYDEESITGGKYRIPVELNHKTKYLYFTVL